MTRRIMPAGRRRRRRFAGAAVAPILAVATLVASTGIGFAAERVMVRGGLHESFGRIVFDWQNPVPYKVATTDRQLTITFDRPMEGRFDKARAEIPDYIGDARLEDAGKRVVIDLKRPVTARHFVNEKSIVVDLRWRDKNAAPVAAKAPPQVRDLPRVPVLVSSRNGYTRIVFDWPVRTEYRFSEHNDRVSLTFERPGELAVPASAVSVAPMLTDIKTTRREDGAVQVELGIAGRVRHFRDGRKIIVDILADKNAQQDAPAAQTVAPAADPATIDAPVQLVPVALRPAEETAQALPADAEALAVDVKVELDGVGLAFPFAVPTSMASFRRGGFLWLVFDRPYRVDTGPIAAAGEFITAAEQLEHPRATILRLATAPGFNASVAREANRWEVTIAPQLMRPDNPIPVSANPGPHANVALGPTVPTTPLAIRDPEVGDRIIAVTVANAGNGLARAYQYSDFRLLASVQGVAIVPYADGLKVDPQAQKIVITAAGGLRLATAKARRRVLASATATARAEVMFDFAAWRGSGDGTFEETEKRLLGQVESAAPDARNAVRLKLARFYFAHGLEARARGVLQLIETQADDSTQLATFKALRGAVNYVMGDLDKARKDLLNRDLDSEPEIILWRAALAAEDGRFAEAAEGLQKSDRFVQNYPDKLRKRFAFLGAETALANNDALGGEFWLDIAEGASLSASDQQYKRVLRAVIAAQDGEIDTALKMYDGVINNGDRRSRARAVLEKTELLLAEGEIAPQQAIDDLDRLRYVWRGDKTEFRILRLLGELQIDNGKFRDGLQSLKRLVTNFPDHRLTPGIADYMRKTFAELYEAGKIQELPPVMAIALFNDFRELAPAGPEGDEMIRRLADRLVSVDLLPQAAQLLAHQVEFRLKGEDKARVGARLAVIHLLNRDPGEALAAIADSHYDGASPDLQAERALLTARAYTQLDDLGKALEALAGNDSEAAGRVRADIMWKKRDWPAAAEVYGRLAGNPPAPGQTLDDVRSRYVLSRAVALALNGDLQDLVVLHQQFEPSMAATPYGADFQVISSVDSGAADFQDVLRRISVADDFQAFIEGYRARLAQTQTAANDSSLN